MMLSALIWIPVLGALLIGFGAEPLIPSRARLVALLTVGSVFLLTIVLGSQFEAGHIGRKFAEHVDWIEPLGLTY